MRCSNSHFGIILAMILTVSPPARGQAQSSRVETNFATGAELSPRDLDAVVKLANLCGLDRVSGVSTERHLSRVTICVSGDEQIVGRRVLFKTLMVHREGWPGEGPKPDGAKSVDEFWIGSPTKPIQEERTIVRVGNRTLRVGLLNGIKPEGADRVIEAFVSGRVRYQSNYLKDRIWVADFTRPNWLGISGGKCWASFASSPLRRVVFDVQDNDVVITDVIDAYE